MLSGEGRVHRLAAHASRSQVLHYLGAFHVSSHAVFKCKLTVKEQNFNRIYVKIQWAFVGCACSGLHFTWREGKCSGRMNGGSGQTEKKNDGSRTGSNVRPGISKLFSICELSTGNFAN